MEPTLGREPTDLEFALWDRHNTLNWGFIGPLTQEQQENADAYERYMNEAQEEYLAQQAAGGRTICPKCGKRSVRNRSVCTLGYPGHPGAEYSAYYKCENCDYKDL